MSYVYQPMDSIGDNMSRVISKFSFIQI